MATRSARRLVAGAAIGGALALFASGIGSIALAADHGVDIAGFAFSPQTITIAVGDTVTWTNADAQGHTATADGGAFDTGRISGGGSASATFATAGTFAYHCSIHPAMTATIEVEAGAASPPATDTAPAGPAGARARAAGWLILAVAGIGGAWLARRRFRRASARR